MSMVPGVILIVVGAVIAVVSLVSAVRAKRQYLWDQVEGKITASGNRLWGGNAYFPEIEYSYAHNGRTFRGTRLRSLLITTNISIPSARDAGRYPVGANIVVYVNPACSREAVLEPGGHSWFLPFMTVLSSIPIGIGCYILA